MPTHLQIMTALVVIAASCKASPPQVTVKQDARAADAGPPALESRAIDWTCTGAPCPWGPKQTNQALVWPTSTKAIATRLGYAVSAPVYLPAAQANGVVVSVDTGTATVHAGPPAETTHRLLATLKPGESLEVSGLKNGEVLSVQGDTAFTYRVTLRAVKKPAPGGTVVSSIEGRWRCNKVPGCNTDPWPGAVIAWPEWSAKQSNGRSGNGNGNVSRSVFSVAGEPLYPYMGAWAEGCEVTGEEGVAQIIEWQYGAEKWRSTILLPGESHVIHLVPPENGALIEADDGVTSFSVSLRDCTPKRRDAKH